MRRLVRRFWGGGFGVAFDGAAAHGVDFVAFVDDVVEVPEVVWRVGDDFDVVLLQVFFGNFQGTLPRCICNMGG